MRIRIKQKKTNLFRKPGCWVAMGTLAAYAIHPPAAARAQKPAASGQSPPNLGAHAAGDAIRHRAGRAG